MFSEQLVTYLSQKEKLLALDMSKNYIKIINMSITNYAKKMDCSVSFITKMLKKVGYYGWKDWVGFISKYITTPISANNYTKYIQHTLINSIYASLNQVDEFTIKDIVELIDKKTSLAFLGSQFGKDICQDQKRRYNKSGKKSEFYDTNNGEISVIPDNSLVFIIMVSGKDLDQKRIINYLRQNKKNCAFIFISSYSRIETNDYYDYSITGILHDNLDINEKELPRHSRLIIFCLLDYIYVKWFEKHKQKINSTIRQVISNGAKIRPKNNF